MRGRKVSPKAYKISKRAQVLPRTKLETHHKESPVPFPNSKAFAFDSSRNVKIDITANFDMMLKEGINNAIHEYLVKQGMQTTLLAFRDELLKAKSVSLDNFHIKMFELFETGNKKEFFDLWDYYVPLPLRMHDRNTIKSEFFLMIYFTIYSIHPYIDSKNKRLLVDIIDGTSVVSHTAPINSGVHTSMRNHGSKADAIVSYIRNEKINFKNNVDELDEPHQIDAEGYKLAMGVFREYLASQGDELSKIEELIPYFALPYLKEPMGHPVFKKLFSRSWLMQLKKLLTNFLASLYYPESKPFLLHMYEQYNQREDHSKVAPVRNISDQDDQKENQSDRQNKSQYDSATDAEWKAKTSQLKQQLMFSEQRIKELEIICSNSDSEAKKAIEDHKKEWRELYAKTFDLAEGLLQFGKIFKNGREFFIQKAENKLNELKELTNFKNYEEELSEAVITQEDKIGHEVTRKDLKVPVNENLVRNFFYFDFDMLKEDMIKDDSVKTKFEFLANLETITTSADPYLKRAYAVIFNQVDALGINNRGSGYTYKIFLNNPEIATNFLMLVNEMTIDHSFRSYISKNKELVERLISIIKTEDEDTEQRRNALGILQKISLQPRNQTLMVDENLVDRIISVIGSKLPSLSDYSLEYFLALLMNLILNPKGLAIFENQDNLSCLDMLLSLLKDCSQAIRHFINGIIYSLLVSGRIKQYFIEMNLKSIITQNYDDLDDIFKQQVDFIIQRLENESPEDLSLSIKESDDIDALVNCFEIDEKCGVIAKTLKANYPDFWNTYNKNYLKFQYESLSTYFEAFFAEDETIQFEVTNNDRPLDRPSTPSYLSQGQSRVPKKSHFSQYNYTVHQEDSDYTSNDSNDDDVIMRQQKNNPKSSHFSKKQNVSNQNADETEIEDMSVRNRSLVGLKTERDKDPRDDSDLRMTSSDAKFTKTPQYNENRNEWLEAFDSKPLIPRTPILIDK